MAEQASSQGRREQTANRKSHVVFEQEIACLLAREVNANGVSST
jgi:hypothetical protein